MSVLFLVVGVDGVVGGEVEATALLALEGEAGDEIAHVDHVAEFADVLRRLHALEEVLRFLVEHMSRRSQARCRRRSERTIPT